MLIVLLFARWRGALALVGLAVSLLIVAKFVVPAILDGTEPVGVAVVGALAVLFVTISLAHGIGPQSIAAMLGTAMALRRANPALPVWRLYREALIVGREHVAATVNALVSGTSGRRSRSCCSSASRAPRSETP